MEEEKNKLREACKKYYDYIVSNHYSPSRKVQIKILKQFSLHSQYYPLHITCEHVRQQETINDESL